LCACRRVGLPRNLFDEIACAQISQMGINA